MGEPAEMRYATPRLRHAAVRLLAHEAGGEPATSEALAAASARLHDRLSTRLAEVIGSDGVQAIFLRAVPSGQAPRLAALLGRSPKRGHQPIS